MTARAGHLALLAGCAAPAAPAQTPAAPAEPMTITHALGQTTIPSTPQRIVALEWTYVENLLALGIQPIGVADIAGYNYTYGALFVTYHVDGDPYKARAYFKTIDGNIIDSFEIYAGSPSLPTPTHTPMATATPIPSGQARTIAVPIAQGMDDVEEQQSGGIYTNSTDLELVQDGNVQTVGLRFQNVDLPPSATVTNVYVQFTTDATRSLTVNALIVAGERTANAAPFTTAINNVSARVRTNATAAWSPPLWTIIDEAGPGQRTPDLSAVVQEIIDLPGWQSGNAIAVIVTGEGRREAYAFEGDPARAPVLYVEYLTP
jgi:hypothetical protein